jgi:type II secretory pathway component GspD/PulD (secretin)
VQGIVSATLDDVTFHRALDRLLAGTECRVEVTGDCFLVYGPDVTSERFTDISVTRFNQLTCVSPEAARTLLPAPLQRYVRFEPGATRLAITAPTLISERIVEDLTLLDRASGETLFFMPHTINAERARDLRPANLRGFVRVDPQRNTLGIITPPEAADIIMEQLSRLDVALPPTGVVVPNVAPSRVVRLNHARAKTVIDLPPMTVADFVRADETTNTVAVSAPLFKAPAPRHDQ